jgi:hypothetical protein
MNIEDIQKFLDKKTSAHNEHVKISFRNREAIFGLFVKGYRDYSDLASKNFWRIVLQSQFASYQRTGDVGLLRSSAEQTLPAWPLWQRPQNKSEYTTKLYYSPQHQIGIHTSGINIFPLFG